MPDIRSVKDRFYIVATSSMVDPFRLILKDGDIFGVFDRFGDILPLGKKEQGLYYGGTRHLSHYELRINGIRPLFLSSNIDDNNFLLTVDLTNPDIYSKNKLLINRDCLHIMRSRFLSGRRSLEHIRVKNFGNEKVAFTLELVFENDFRDIFEVRGFKRKKRGNVLAPEIKDGELRLVYEGLDDVKRTTSIRFNKKPSFVKNGSVKYRITLKPEGSEELDLTVDCLTEGVKVSEVQFASALEVSRKRLGELDQGSADIQSSNAQFNEAIKRSVSDINMMLTDTEHGYYPYGGIPWYCTPFGRDGIITALECLWLKPKVAEGVLRYLSARQARSLDGGRASQPGKILHEARGGELAALNEIPFGLYYGSVDSTPLYIVLAGAYWRRTGDTELIKGVWKSIEDAIEWMERYGDVDGDGFLEYVPDVTGLRNQGWKDSQDSIFHKDGTLAEGAIALAEVQGYYYAAKMEAAGLANLMDRPGLSKRLLREAGELKERFNKAFWDEELSTYILALDGNKRPCRVIASNAGHALFSGIAEPDKARRVADTLVSDKAFSGWGVRTVAANEARYNPMSYHNGSVWPHDNAMIAYGLASYGLAEHFTKIFTGLFDASLFMEFHRLPELFCGFHRRGGVAPTLYPVACSPQTWAAGSLIYLLQASLGLNFEAEKGMLIFKKPILPEFIDHLYLKNLPAINGKTVDLAVMRRYGRSVTIEPLRKPEDISVLIIT